MALVNDDVKRAVLRMWNAKGMDVLRGDGVYKWPIVTCADRRLYEQGAPVSLTVMGVNDPAGTPPPPWCGARVVYAGAIEAALVVSNPSVWDQVELDRWNRPNQGYGNGNGPDYMRGGGVHTVPIVSNAARRIAEQLGFGLGPNIADPFVTAAACLKAMAVTGATAADQIDIDRFTARFGPWPP